jgi:hypothetical protein
MKIYQNVLSQQTFAKITNEIFADSFPWYYGDTAYRDNKDSSLYGYSFFHMLFSEGEFKSPYGSMLEMALLTMLDTAGERIDKLIRLRLGMITVTSNTVFHPPHVDFDFPHRTGLFYFNNADGDTVLYNEKFNPTSAIDGYEYYQQNQNRFTVKNKIAPAANTFVTFDGLHYHQSSTPTSVPRRIVMNVNYTIK